MASEIDPPDDISDGEQYGTTKTQILSNPPNLLFLQSANFSTDSLGDSDVYDAHAAESVPGTPTIGLQQSPIPRRYSNSSLASPQRTTFSNRTPRPKSVFDMDTSQLIILEDGSPAHRINNTPRARNSAYFASTRSYIPSAPIAPPSGSRSSSPIRATSPSRNGRNYRAKSPVRRSSSPSKSPQPFNFQPQELMIHGNGSGPTLQVKTAHRKGHKYKHSSVSMNLFQEPPPAAVSANQAMIPDLHPIPTFKESVSSLTSHQKIKLAWSVCHLLLAVALFIVGFHFKLASLSTLAHLVVYDSLGSLVIVLVDVMSNFEVWSCSSIAYPFGLGRLEVLAGFALSTSLIMVGCDLISHFCEEFVIEWIVKDPQVDQEAHQHLSHHIHGGGTIENMFAYEVSLCITIIFTLLTSRYIVASDRINEMISSTGKEKGGEGRIRPVLSVILKHPTHFLTLLFAIGLALLPVIPEAFTSKIDLEISDASTLTIACLLCFTGWRLVSKLGSILLLSYPYSSYDYYNLKNEIIDGIYTIEGFKKSFTVDKLFITKFNHRLFVVGLKILMIGASIDDESRFRFEINRLISRKIATLEYASPQLELTIDITR
ncbi:hypothetical protein QFC19_009332 [Naganishia cerealis]|uniref:Uncharacterized protein n=1 Tax=Naganishia cerealis TaxID=610337 RepID=A0ACC2UWY0_9TREE|nr:hypothetical protein QFC19_009332 [Naganishia cerealis]